MIYAILLIPILLIWVYYSKFNSIKTAQNQISNSLSSLDALLIKRHDLLPNLITLIKQYMAHETDTLQKITQLRSQATPAPNAEYAQDSPLNKLVSGLMVQVENYPDLKANDQFLNLQYSWNEVEEQIAAGRRFVSASITDYNNQITTFPGNIIAGSMNAKPYEWQKATEVQRENINATNYFN
mgnify:CR=1 FL=1